MKHVYPMLVYLLFVVSCATAQPTPTAQPTASHTVAPPPAINTTAPPPTRTATLTIPPTHTGTATHTATPTTTKTPIPTKTATATPLPTLPPPPPPTGHIYFFWDPNPLPSSGYGSLNQSLYLASPGSGPDNWQIEPLLNEVYGLPFVALSPDQTKLAFTILEDRNGDGSISDTGYEMGFDWPNIFFYSLIDDILQRVTDDYPEVYSLSWLPNSLVLTYPNVDTVFSFNTSDFSKTQLVGPFTDEVPRLAWSPNGNLLAIELSSGILYLLHQDTGEVIQVTNTPADYESYIFWSPNGQWLASTTFSGVGLFVVNSETLEISTLATMDYFVSPAWSPNSEKLAMVQTVRDVSSSLSIWSPVSKAVDLIMERDFISDVNWSNDSSTLAVSYLRDGYGGILLLDPASGKVQVLTEMENVTEIYLVTWSPDDEWLLFFSRQPHKAGLYLIHRSGSESNLLLETTDTYSPNGLFWLP